MIDAVLAILERTKGNLQRHQLFQEPHVPVQLVSRYVKGDKKAYAVALVRLWCSEMVLCYGIRPYSIGGADGGAGGGADSSADGGAENREYI